MNGVDLTAGVALDLVLLGSRLALGPLELLLSAVLLVLWLLFGVWLWRASAATRRAALALVYGFSGIGLLAATLAQDALLFYAGLAVASYGIVALLLRVHGPGHARTAAAQVVLLVLGDLILFELLAYLYTEGQSTGFDALRAAFQAKGGGMSFVGGLLVATGGCRVAGLFLLMPMPGRLQPWQAGSAPGLLCLALLAGPLIVARITDPALASVAVWYTLLATLAAACVLYLLAVTFVLAQARLASASQWLSTRASRAASFGAGLLAALGELSQRLAPRCLALERRLLSWPVAVATATVFAALLALTVALAGAAGST